MKITKKVAWPTIFIISCLSWWSVSAGMAYCCWWLSLRHQPKTYHPTTQKPINYDKPKEDTTLYGRSEILRLDTAD